MNKLWAAIEVLQKGRELSNKEVWKNTQLLASILTSILASAALIAGVNVSDAQVDAIALGVVTVAGIANSYLTAATSASVGLPSKPDLPTESDPGP